MKRLLQHERQSQTSASSRPAGNEESLSELAKHYVGTNEDGTLADTDLRNRLTHHLMDDQAHKLTVSRITAEAKGQVKVSAAASILKNSATKIAQTKNELTMEMMGSQGLGWEGNNFTDKELENVREWLWGKAISIYGGSQEVPEEHHLKEHSGPAGNNTKGLTGTLIDIPDAIQKSRHCEEGAQRLTKQSRAAKLRVDCSGSPRPQSELAMTTQNTQ